MSETSLAVAGKPPHARKHANFYGPDQLSRVWREPELQSEHNAKCDYERARTSLETSEKLSTGDRRGSRDDRELKISQLRRLLLCKLQANLLLLLLFFLLSPVDVEGAKVSKKRSDSSRESHIDVCATSKTSHIERTKTCSELKSLGIRVYTEDRGEG